MSYYEDRMAELRAERAREAVEREKRRDEELAAKRRHRANPNRYVYTCLECNVQGFSARPRMYCSDACRFKAANAKRRVEIEKELAKPEQRRDPDPILSRELRALQAKQREAQNARRLKAELDATSYRLEGGMTDEEREAFRREMSDKVKQGRNRVHAYFIGHGPGI